MDTRLNAVEFYEPRINQGIIIHDLGGVEAFNGFAERLRQVGELKHEQGTKEAITELKSLMRWHRVENNSARNSEISGSLSGRIAETSIYGKERKSDVDLELGKIKKAISDFARKAKNGKNGGDKKQEIIEKRGN